jgi:hypothetical protein
MASSRRFGIEFDATYGLLSKALLIPPSDSYVEITDQDVTVRMAWAFRARFDRSHVARASLLGRQVLLTRGVHGWGGRWLVNGTGDGIVVFDLTPKQRAYVVGVPVSLGQLQVSVADPSALLAAVNQPH